MAQTTNPEELRPLFEELMRAGSLRLRKIVERLAAGEIALQEWYETTSAALLDQHTDAYVLGRNLAGVPGDKTDADFLRGLAQRDKDADYLLNFLDALEAADDRYFDEDGNPSLEAIDSRVQMYNRKARATANIAFVEASAADELWDWNLGAAEHCDDCVFIAELSPFTRETLWTVPGDGDTECLTNCNCNLSRRSDGLEGFARPPMAA